jgi:hypothetical protein
MERLMMVGAGKAWERRRKIRLAKPIKGMSVGRKPMSKSLFASFSSEKEESSLTPAGN